MLVVRRSLSKCAIERAISQGVGAQRTGGGRTVAAT
jgi:hypothetical protein